MFALTTGRFLPFVFAVLIGATMPAQVQAPPIPAAPGVAAGTVQFGKTTIKLAHAYASGPESAGGKVYRIVLTDRPVPADALAVELKWGGGQKLMRAGKLDGVLLNVDENGSVRVVIPFIADIRGSQPLTFPTRLPTFSARDGVITGQASYIKERGYGWTLMASWHAKAMAPRLP
jgi:hypothetical protein